MKYNLEFLRLIAVILVTFTHTRNNFTGGWEMLIFEDFPKIGTLVLSIISGYLYSEVTYNRKNLLKDKFKKLYIPYFIANLLVVVLVIIASYFGYHFLNRYSIDYVLFTEGLFALNVPPVNPPTYFIRDIFIVFILIDLFKNKNYTALLIIIPLVIFGKLFIRIDILLLFAVGVLISKYTVFIKKNYFYILIFLTISSIITLIKTPIDIYKYPIAFLFFMIMLQVQIKFYNVGAFSYLLHLYHSPIMVVSAFFLKIDNPILFVLAQIFAALLGAYLLYITTRIIKPLRVLSGGK